MSIAERFRAGEVGYAEALDYLCSFMDGHEEAVFRKTACGRFREFGVFTLADLFTAIRGGTLDECDEGVYKRLCHRFYGEMAEDGLPESADEWRLERV